MILAEAKKTCPVAERVSLHHAGLIKAYDLQNVKNPVCILLTKVSGFMWERHLAAHNVVFRKAYRGKMPLPQFSRT
jgi:hypothetical protein